MTIRIRSVLLVGMIAGAISVGPGIAQNTPLTADPNATLGDSECGSPQDEGYQGCILDRTMARYGREPDEEPDSSAAPADRQAGSGQSGTRPPEAAGASVFDDTAIPGQ